MRVTPSATRSMRFLFLVPFVVLALMGGGRYSLDHRVGRPR